MFRTDHFPTGHLLEKVRPCISKVLHHKLRIHVECSNDDSVKIYAANYANLKLPSDSLAEQI